MRERRRERRRKTEKGREREITWTRGTKSSEQNVPPWFKKAQKRCDNTQTLTWTEKRGETRSTSFERGDRFGKVQTFSSTLRTWLGDKEGNTLSTSKDAYNTHTISRNSTKLPLP
jgi:hypothetical protein